MNQQPTKPTPAILERIANNTSRSEKVAWMRKYKNMQTLITEVINPLEDEIMTLQAKKMEVFDKLHKHRNEMVEICIHPADFLELRDNHVHCKFCGRNLNFLSQHHE